MMYCKGVNTDWENKCTSMAVVLNRPNPWGSVSQPQGFGRGPLKYKHSCIVQSDLCQLATERRRGV